jgi:uncharacterized protein YggE
MKKIFLFALLVSSLCLAQSPVNQPKTITVTGSSEMLVEPDEIKFIINIEEYWKEEFEKKKEFEDYKTKVPISEIESDLLEKLYALGVKKEDILVSQVGNYNRHQGKEFLIGKEYIITLHDFNLIDKITTTLDSKGISSMYLGELKNKNIQELRKQVKISALKAAKEKAAYLLESLDKKLGDVISITENNDSYYFGSLVSNMSLENNSPGIENIKKIKLKYEITATFEFK